MTAVIITSSSSILQMVVVAAAIVRARPWPTAHPHRLHHGEEREVGRHVPKAHESNAGVRKCDHATQQVPNGNDRQTHTHTHMIRPLYADYNLL